MIHGLDTSFLIAVELTTHPRHAAARQLLKSLAGDGDRFALCPPVLAEFVHVITDARRCSLALDIPAALLRAEQLWTAAETVQVFSSTRAVSQFFDWMRSFRLGRKRLLDTQLAASFQIAGVTSVLTLNRADFEVFGTFSFPEL